MPKKIINDIIVTKRSIRQIPISAEKRHRYDSEQETKDTEQISESRSIKSPKIPNWQRKTLSPKFLIWFLAIICLLALFFGISILFSSATVIITPRTEKLSFEGEYFLAKKDSTNVNDLSFEILTIKQEMGEIVEATGDKEVSLKATGKIIIYNNYSTTAQRLINNTRFEANNGKIYRLNSSVIVPGYTKSEGKIVPGSIEVTVFADQAGEEYNLKLADLTGDFKIPGFKGDPRYQSFYARLKTDISGGYIGRQRVVVSEIRETTEEALKTKLKEQLLKELYAVKPEDYLIFKDGYSIEYSNLSDTSIDNDKVKINMSGQINAIVFNNSKLAKYFALKKIKDFKGLPVQLIPTQDMSVIFKGDDMTNLSRNKTLEIGLTGTSTLKYLYDSQELREALVGKSNYEVKSLVNEYQATVLGMKVIFRPVWNRYFPDNINKIKIEEAI